MKKHLLEVEHLKDFFLTWPCFQIAAGPYEGVENEDIG